MKGLHPSFKHLGTWIPAHDQGSTSIPHVREYKFHLF